MKRAVFFDRDGTLIDEAGYLRRPEQVRLKPGAAQAVRRLKEAGFLVVVVSNQSGVARGLVTTEDVDRANQRLQELLGEQDAHIDAFYYCPHLPAGTVPAYAKQCECRKPKPGLLYEAAQDLDIDVTESFVVGDAVRDVEAGRSAGCHTVFVGDVSLMNAGARGQVEVFAETTAATLGDAADYILRSADLEGQPAGAPTDVGQGEGVQTEPTPAEKPTVSTAARPGERTCSRCGRSITEEDVRGGLAVERRGRQLCPVCVDELRLKRGVPPEKADSNFQAIVDELRAINRALTFETFSVMNVLGGVIQVGALGCLFKAYQLGS
ncbi:MAG: HAD family hydrolase, partial [Planctomycetes bacterium]|nr:HAD family hydrolase [Planctomycetota bacterium]